MATQKHTVEQIISKLRQAEVEVGQGRTMGEVCRSLGVAEQTYYRWRKEYGGLKMDQAKRLKEVEQENTRLRKAVTELTLDKLILKEAAGETSKPGATATVCCASARGTERFRTPGVPGAGASTIDPAASCWAHDTRLQQLHPSLLLTFPTDWGICYSLNDDSRSKKTLDSCTVWTTTLLTSHRVLAAYRAS